MVRVKEKESLRRELTHISTMDSSTLPVTVALPQASYCTVARSIYTPITSVYSSNYPISHSRSSSAMHVHIRIGGKCDLSDFGFQRLLISCNFFLHKEIKTDSMDDKERSDENAP